MNIEQTKTCEYSKEYECPYSKKCKVYLGTAQDSSVSIFSSNLVNPGGVYWLSGTLMPKSRIWTKKARDMSQLLVVCNPSYLGKESFFKQEEKKEHQRDKERLKNIESRIKDCLTEIIEECDD